jgi:ABC-type multidrug transport system fused ATPase/permease subunit
MKDVYFSYPARPDFEVLKGIDLTLKPGNVVALVGPSGGGKTTIVALLEMFYYPSKGKIFLDGVDITELDPKFLRSAIGLVSQEPSLFGRIFQDFSNSCSRNHDS